VNLPKPERDGGTVSFTIEVNGYLWSFSNTRSSEADAANLLAGIETNRAVAAKWEEERSVIRSRSIDRLVNSNRQLRAYIRRMKERIETAV
jgi:hypothetical protein